MLITVRPEVNSTAASLELRKARAESSRPHVERDLQFAA
jgi:hypothetical protein